MNKWDLVENKNNATMKKMKEELYAELPFLSYAPIEFVSALTGQRTTNLLEIADRIYEEYTKRISTGLLNTILKDAVLMNNPPTRKGRVIKLIMQHKFLLLHQNLFYSVTIQSLYIFLMQDILKINLEKHLDLMEA